MSNNIIYSTIALKCVFFLGKTCSVSAAPPSVFTETLGEITSFCLVARSDPSLQTIVFIIILRWTDRKHVRPDQRIHQRGCHQVDSGHLSVRPVRYNIPIFLSLSFCGLSPHLIFCFFVALFFSYLFLLRSPALSKNKIKTCTKK